MAQQRKIQMETPNGWRYVFCVSGNCPAGGIILTDSFAKALPYWHLEYFHTHFANRNFRAI
jgi:hypothetical protein